MVIMVEIQSSRESTIWICSASHSGNEQYNPSPMPLSQHINQSNRCIWYRRVKSVAVLPIGYGKSYLLVSSVGLDTSALVFFWLVIVLSNCPSSWAIFIIRCQTLQLFRSGSGFPGLSRSQNTWTETLQRGFATEGAVNTPVASTLCLIWPGDLIPWRGLLNSSKWP